MKFVLLISLVVCTGMSAIAATPDRSAPVRPNILLLFADDLGRYASAYADPAHPSPNDIISTPAFDRVAREGALFRNAFVSVPSCTPSRAALNTGRHFFRNASHSQLHHPWQKGTPDPFDGIKGMPVTLQEGGYHIGLTYKLHMRAGIIGGKQNLYNQAGGNLNQYSQFVSKAKDRAAAKEKILGQVRGNFRNFLAKRGDGQPFFYSFNPTNTHRKWIRGSGKALWGLDPDSLKGKLPPVLPDTEVIREDFADYLGEAMAFDAACATLIAELEKLGELDNTIVAISGDHGAPGFPRGKCNVHDFGSRVLLAIRWPKHVAGGRDVSRPVSLIDLAPTFLAAAGLESSDDPNGQNLLPGIAPGSDDTMLRPWVLIGREVHAGSSREGNLPYPVRAIRTTDHLYVMNFKPERWPAGDPFAIKDGSTPPFNKLANDTYVGFPDIDASPTKAWLVHQRAEAKMTPFLDFAWGKRPAEELYDLHKDPQQLKNLAGNPEYEPIRKRLRAELMEELKDNKDPRLDNDAFDRPPYLSGQRR